MMMSFSHHISGPKTRMDRLIELYTAIHHQQNVETASKLLEEAYQQKETLDHLFGIISNPCEEFLRCAVALGLRQMFRRGCFEEAQVPHVRTALVDVLRSQDSEYTRRLLGDTAIEFIKKTKLFEWPEFYELCLAMLGDAKTVETGMFLWIGIIEILPEMGILQYFEQLIECIVGAISNGTVACRVYAVQLFDMLTARVSHKVFDDCVQIPELFLRVATSILSDPAKSEDIESCRWEASVLFECVSAQLINEMEVFLKYGEPFVKFALDLTVSPADPSLRATCQSILAVVPQIFPDLVMDQLPIFLNAVLQLGVALCEQDRENGEIQFVGTFADSIATNTESAGQLLELLLTFAGQAVEKKSAAALQVAVIALAACLGSARDEIEEASEDVVLLVMQAMQLDKDLFDAGCAFLLEASSVCPEIMTCMFDEIVDILFKHISEARALQTLDFVMYSVEMPPSNYKEVLSALTGLLNHCSPDKYDSLISCMTSAISSVDDVDNDMYTSMRGILTHLLQSDAAARAKVFECFGFLAKIAPQAIQGDLPELMKVLFASFSTEDANMNENIAMCITNVARILPLAVQPFVPQIVPAFLQLLETEIPSSYDAEEEDENETDTAVGTDVVTMQAAVVNAVATLISELPQEMAPWAEKCVVVISTFLNKPRIALQTAGAKSILLMSEGLRALNFQGAQSIFSAVVESLLDANDVKLASELLVALGSILVNFGSSLSSDDIEKCLELFEQCFSRKIEILYMGKSLSPEILDSLFFACRMFIFGLGENFVHVADRFLEFLRPHMNSKKRTVQAYVVHTLGAIILTCPACGSYCSMACQLAMRCMNDKSNTVRNVLLAGMNYIVVANKDALPGDVVTALRQVVHGVLSKQKTPNSDAEMIFGTAATLWCSLCIAFGPQGKNFMNELNRVLECLPPVIDDDDMPFTAQFLYHALQQWPDAVTPHAKRILVNVFASGEWCLNLAPREVLATLAGLVQEIPEAEVMELLKWNQHHLLQLKRNIEKYRG